MEPEKICSNCGNILNPNSRFCGKCGNRVSKKITKVTPEPVALKEVISEEVHITTVKLAEPIVEPPAPVATTYEEQNSKQVATVEEVNLEVADNSVSQEIKELPEHKADHKMAQAKEVLFTKVFPILEREVTPLLKEAMAGGNKEAAAWLGICNVYNSLKDTEITANNQDTSGGSKDNTTTNLNQKQNSTIDTRNNEEESINKENNSNTDGENKIDKTPLKFRSFQGRMARLEHLIGQLKILGICILVSIVTGLFADSIMGLIILSSLYGKYGTTDVLGLTIVVTGMFLMGCFILLIIVYNISLSVRRLHDLNLSGWFFALNFIPVINVIFGLVLFFKKGTEGINKYGLPRV